MEEEKDMNFRGVLIFVGISIVFFLIMKGKGYVQIDYGLFWPLLVGCLILSGQTIIWWSRYQMPHLVLNGFSGSILGRPEPVRDKNGVVWAVFNTGEYLDPIHGRGKIATAICPWNQLNQLGKNYAGATLVNKTPFRLLPSFLNNFLRYNKDRFNIDKIYYGFVSEKFIHKNPKFDTLKEEIENLNSRINSQRKIIEGKNDELIEQIELNKKITGRENPLMGILRRNPNADQGVRE